MKFAAPALVAITALASTAAAGSADTSAGTTISATYVLKSQLLQTDPIFNEEDGTLKLQIAADGNVSGFYYTNQDPAHLIPITGGLRGSHLWFEFHPLSPSLQADFYGTFKDGKVDVFATSFSHLTIHNQPAHYELIAKPAASPAPHKT